MVSVERSTGLMAASPAGSESSSRAGSESSRAGGESGWGSPRCAQGHPDDDGWTDLDLGESPGLDVAGLVRRARRVTDLSQRDLARLLGVSQAALAQWETGRRLPGLRQFEAVARLAGLRVVVVVAEPAQEDPVPTPPSLGDARCESADDSPGSTEAWPAATPSEAPMPAPPLSAPPLSAAPLPGTAPAEAALPVDGRCTALPVDARGNPLPVDARGIVQPMRNDGVRDGGGRRYPAHLDPAPHHQVWRPRWDRPELNVRCHRRRRRDAERARAESWPLDHVTAGEIAATLARWRQDRLETLRRSLRLRSQQLPATTIPSPIAPPTIPSTQLRSSHPQLPAPESGLCTCPLDCETDGPCLESCPCGCEPDPSWRP